MPQIKLVIQPKCCEVINLYFLVSVLWSMGDFDEDVTVLVSLVGRIVLKVYLKIWKSCGVRTMEILPPVRTVSQYS